MQMNAMNVLAFEEGGSGSIVGNPSQKNQALIEAGRQVYNFVGIIAEMIGLIFIMVGIIKYAMAHMEMDGGAEMKASLMIGTGIGLCAVTGILWVTFVG